MSSTSSLKNGDLSLATFKVLRVQKPPNSNRVALSVILPAKGPIYACFKYALDFTVCTITIGSLSIDDEWDDDDEMMTSCLKKFMRGFRFRRER